MVSDKETVVLEEEEVTDPAAEDLAVANAVDLAVLSATATLVEEALAELLEDEADAEEAVEERESLFSPSSTPVSF